MSRLAFTISLLIYPKMGWVKMSIDLLNGCQSWTSFNNRPNVSKFSGPCMIIKNIALGCLAVNELMSTAV